MKNKLSIIIVHYNQQDLLRKCIQSLEKLTVSYEIIIVDNNSSDFCTVEYENNDKIKIIRNSENYGYGKACNIGAKAAKNEILFFLNPDTEYIYADWLELFGLINENSVGLVYPGLFFPNGKRQYSCRTFYNIRILFARKFFSSFFEKRNFMKRHFYFFEDYDKKFEVDWGLGGAFIVCKEVFFDLNGFDERYFLYFEDVDLAYYSKRKGYRNIYFPSSKILHHHQRQSKKLLSKAALLHFFSMLKYIKKWLIKF